ncbi:hypothetical protein [Williamsia sp.]|uniref:hypothetical protein n=1 Tax=Williamsia sp. TaxID=1872085 RepID=UPI002F95147C
MATVSLVAIPALLVPAVNAAPGDGGTPAQAPVVDFRTLGRDSTVAIYGQEGETSLTIPVPPGLTASEIQASVQVPPNLQRATLTATQGTETLARVELPVGAPAPAPIAIGLRGAEIIDNAVDLTLRTDLVPINGTCLVDTDLPVELTGAAINFAGTEATPETIADFLPPLLEKLTIAIPAAPTQTESDAAVALTSSMVARYGAQPIDVAVEALPDGQQTLATPSEALERQITILERPASAVELVGSVGVPTLLISGPAPDLTNQVNLLTSNLSRLAISSKAVAGPLRVTPQLPPSSTTLADIGEPGRSATATTNPQVTIGIDQTRLGRSAKGIRVNLKGSYTPLPPNYGGQVVVSVGDTVIDRWAAEPNGIVDTWVDIPDDLLQRFTDLTVAVDAAGNTGGCGDSAPITLTIDGDSPVESTNANPPLPTGFQSVPQSMMPQIEVGIGPDSFADTIRAVTIVEGLQRLSAVPISTTVVPLEQALSSSNPAILISASGWDDNELTLPVSKPASGPIMLTGVDGNNTETSLTLDPDVNFGSLQTVYDGERTMLVATSTDVPAQLDRLLNWLDEDEARWVTVNGDALVQAADRDPITVITDSATPQQQSDDNNDSAVRWIAAGVLVVIAIVVAIIVLRSRRREPGS